MVRLKGGEERGSLRSTEYEFGIGSQKLMGREVHLGTSNSRCLLVEGAMAKPSIQPEFSCPLINQEERYTIVYNDKKKKSFHS
jgi:hypothetical protein